jgi:hypothetical protein
MRRPDWKLIACACAGIALASMAVAAAKPPPEWPGTYVYRDDAGNIVGEANNALCHPQDAWGVVTANVTARLGCGLSQ